MSIALVYTRAKIGVEAPLVQVETHLSNGLPALSIVGLPEAAVKESKDRVRSAIINSHFEFPTRRITINLAPADLPKEGGRFDLAIALGILAASGQIPASSLETLECLGELGLGGELRAVKGALPAAMASAKAGRTLFLPTENAVEAALCHKATILSANNLLQLAAHLHGREILSPQPATQLSSATLHDPDLSQVRGQAGAKRALEIAAAGHHNVLMSGPPGTGKSMLASRLPGLLPRLNEAELLEVAAIQSVSSHRTLDYSSIRRPFRSPHHTASAAALVGGGSHPKPGEISLAHRGVLFLDELPEFQRHVLEVLREPMESGEIMISRANRQVLFPACFQLVAAMNPCPCGYFGDPERNCRCTPNQLRRYRDRISGPLLDRIDLQLTVNRIPPEQLSALPTGESSADIRKRVERAWQKQFDRQGCSNSQLDADQLSHHCRLTENQLQLLNTAARKLHLSPRAYHRILRVTRTIADLDASKSITTDHLSEAISYRTREKMID